VDAERPPKKPPGGAIYRIGLGGLRFFDAWQRVSLATNGRGAAIFREEEALLRMNQSILLTATCHTMRFI
jgi:hypothetical protein